MKIQDLQVKRQGPFGIKFKGEITVAPKTLLGLYGPNGSGKSSLLKALSGLLSPNERSGFVFFGTEMTDLSKVGSDWARQVLYLGSDFQTPFQITVRELFEMAAAVSKGGVHLELGSAERTRIALVIEALGLTSDLNRILGHMSDGEKQWIMLARGLIQQPRLLLLDETLSKLDMDRLTAVAEILRSSLVDSMSIWIASHDLKFLQHVCDSILLFPRNGAIQIKNNQSESYDSLLAEVYPGLSPKF